MYDNFSSTLRPSTGSSRSAPGWLARCVEFAHTPVHGSWPNTGEIELSVPVCRCLKRRLPEIEVLRRELAAWGVERNRLGTSLD